MTFNAEQAVCISGCSLRQLRYWRDTRLVQPACFERDEDGKLDERYDFANLVELRTIMGMLQKGVSLQKIRKTLIYLREHTDYSRPLAQCKLVTDGSTIFEICESEASILDTLRRGQVALCIALDGICDDLSARLVEISQDREIFVERLMA
ncbi:MAG: MerR family transcriptional regulator [Actinomycetota bacterium]|nr:MerR family transcriptional regulator [Actinomycetota bacterium]MDD5667820.1 MerR family transcriptional regulator [Actinomycetota bacterium]